jgi:hypothetical protein
MAISHSLMLSPLNFNVPIYLFFSDNAESVGMKSSFKIAYVCSVFVCVVPVTVSLHKMPSHITRQLKARYKTYFI